MKVFSKAPSGLFKSYRLLALIALGLGGWFVVSCSGNANKGEDSTKFRQYYVKGEQLYLTHCSNCHQKDGSGLGLVYPPLNKSDYMDNHFEPVICLIENGMEGELIVNGKNFNMRMPGIPTLTDLEIAEISTYIYNSWDHKKGLIEVKEVSEILARCDSLSVTGTSD